MTIHHHAARIAEALRGRMAEIEQAAGEAGQFHQSQEVEDSVWNDGVINLIMPYLKNLVLQCADKCEARADGKHIAIAQESRKCAAQIRHSMLCLEGESICLHCDGEGCKSCGRTGIKP